MLEDPVGSGERHRLGLVRDGNKIGYQVDGRLVKEVVVEFEARVMTLRVTGLTAVAHGFSVR